MKVKRFTSDAPVGDVEILEFVLEGLYGREQRGLAVELLERFGSLRGVFGASSEELKSMGLTDRVADFFGFAHPAFRQAIIRECALSSIKSERELVRFAVALASAIDTPCEGCVYTRCGEVVATDRLIGDKLREIVGNACRYNADGVAVLLYRPTAVTISPERRVLDRIAELIKPLDMLDIEFIDCITLGAYRFFSLRRALSGDDNDVSVASASAQRLDCSNISDKLDAYIKKLDDKKKKAFLPGK